MARDKHWYALGESGVFAFKTITVVVLVIVVLVLGASLVWLLSRDGGGLSGNPTGLDRQTETESQAEGAGRTEASETPMVPAPTGGEGSPSAEGAPSAEEISADISRLDTAPHAQTGTSNDDEPAEEGESSQPDANALDDLRMQWGAGLVPDKLGEWSAVGPAAVGTDVIRRSYRGGTGSSVDVAELTISRLSDAGQAEKAEEGLFESYSEAALVFDLDGRVVRQGVTQEDRPEQFPPALLFTWVRDEFVVAVVVVPAEPGRASVARDEFIGVARTLPY